MSKLRKEIQRWCDYTRYTKSQPAGSYTFRSEIGSNCIHSAPRWREHFKNRRSNCTKLPSKSAVKIHWFFHLCACLIDLLQHTNHSRQSDKIQDHFKLDRRWANLVANQS